MTRAGWIVLSVLMTVSIAVMPAAAGPGPKGDPGAPPGHSVVRQAGQTFCPVRTLVYGNVIIPAGRCYMLSVLRDSGGTFLAFVPPGEKIPPGQLVRLNTQAGPKLKGRLFLIPISGATALVPINTMTLVPVQILDLGTLLRIVLTGTSAPPIEIRER